MKIEYICEGCKGRYRTEAAAMKCEEQNETKHIAEVGDIVLVRAGFSWANGDPGWIENPKVQSQPGHGNCFNTCCTMQFFYVVTAIDMRNHRKRYHLYTGAMKNGFKQGFTFSADHYTPVVVAAPPPRVVEESKRFIGRKAKHLV